jgi:hypothetical protein
VSIGLKALLGAGFVFDASGLLAGRLQSATPETEAETETEAEDRGEKGRGASPKPKNPSARGTRLSADWQPSEKNLEYIREKRPDLNPETVAEKFKNYWVPLTGKSATKLNWDMTWAKWVMEERRANAARDQQETFDERDERNAFNRVSRLIGREEIPPPSGRVAGRLPAHLDILDQGPEQLGLPS